MIRIRHILWPDARVVHAKMGLPDNWANTVRASAMSFSLSMCLGVLTLFFSAVWSLWFVLLSIPALFLIWVSIHLERALRLHQELED